MLGLSGAKYSIEWKAVNIQMNYWTIQTFSIHKKQKPEKSKIKSVNLSAFNTSLFEKIFFLRRIV